MEQMIACAVAMVALLWWDSVAPCRMVKERVYDLVECKEQPDIYARPRAYAAPCGAADHRTVRHWRIRPC